MSQYNKIKWIQLIPILIFSILSLFLWAIYQVSNDYLTLLLYIICSIFSLYCIWKSEIPYNLNIYILNEWKDIKQLERAPQIFLACWFIYISSIVIYIITTQNYKLIILLYIFPMYAMPLLAKVVPSARQYQKLDIYFKKVFTENEEISFFYIITLLATAWIGIIWGTGIITESAESNNRITITIQSITSSLAPLAFYIAWKNYIRKSGIHIIAKLCINDRHLFAIPLYKIQFFNEKDRAISITSITLIINEKISIPLKIEPISLKAYDIMEIAIDPITFFTIKEKSMDPTILISAISDFETSKKQLIIETHNEKYISDISQNNNLIITKKYQQTNYKLTLTSQAIGDNLVNLNDEYIFTEPMNSQAFLIHKLNSQEIIISFMLKDQSHLNQKQFYKAIFCSKSNRYEICFPFNKIWMDTNDLKIYQIFEQGGFKTNEEFNTITTQHNLNLEKFVLILPTSTQQDTDTWSVHIDDNKNIYLKNNFNTNSSPINIS